jgi:hypothetical protein
MGLETSDTIAGLDSSYPLPGDVRRNGDDHLRLLKNVLKKQFPGAGQVGFDAVIVSTEAEINYLSGVTSSVQDQLDALANAVGGVAGVLAAPSGTRMLFHQGTPPAGWTTDPTQDNRIVVTTSIYGGGEAGKDSPFKWTHAHGTQAHTLTTTEIPAHTHHLQTRNTSPAGTVSFDSGNVQQQFVQAAQATWDNGDTQPSGGGGGHAHGNTLTVDWEPLVTLYIVGVKD